MAGKSSPQTQGPVLARMVSNGHLGSRSPLQLSLAASALVSSFGVMTEWDLVLPRFLSAGKPRPERPLLTTPKRISPAQQVGGYALNKTRRISEDFREDVDFDSIH